jgi:hypothetical protein
MTVEISDLDAHEQPSERMRATWKGFSKADQCNLLNGPDIDDPRSEEQRHEYCVAGQISADRIAKAFSRVTQQDHTAEAQDASILYHPLLPGKVLRPWCYQ